MLLLLQVAFDVVELSHMPLPPPSLRLLRRYFYVAFSRTPSPVPQAAALTIVRPNGRPRPQFSHFSVPAAAAVHATSARGSLRRCRRCRVISWLLRVLRTSALRLKFPPAATSSHVIGAVDCSLGRHRCRALLTNPPGTAICKVAAARRATDGCSSRRLGW